MFSATNSANLKSPFRLIKLSNWLKVSDFSVSQAYSLIKKSDRLSKGTSNQITGADLSFCKIAAGSMRLPMVELSAST